MTVIFADCVEPLINVESLALGGGVAALRAAARYTATRSVQEDLHVTSKVLGVGATSTVQLANWHSGTPCALKSIQKTLKSEDLKREVEVYLALEHPCIARLQVVYESVEQVHLVMEHLDGGDALSRLQRLTRFGESAAAGVMRQCLHAVAYMHGHGVVHRDLKLQNLVYQSAGGDEVKVVDFGFACFWDGRSPMTKACGTPVYVAPEVYDRRYTEKADIWSVGVMAFMLATGKEPLPASNSTSRQKLAEGSPWRRPAFRDLPADVKNFLKRLIVLDARVRPSAAEALQHGWLSSQEPDESLLTVVGAKRLRLFAALEPPKRDMAARVAWTLPASTEVQQCFLSLCDAHGCVTRASFVHRLRDLGMDQADVSSIFDELDEDGMGEIFYSQFVAGLTRGSSWFPSPSRSLGRSIRRVFGVVASAFGHLRSKTWKASHRFTSSERFDMPGVRCGETCASGSSRFSRHSFSKPVKFASSICHMLPCK